MEKLNSYWLLKQNDCDILCKIQDLILDNQSCCILDALDGTDHNHQCIQHQNEMIQHILCHKCIQNWMSSERK